MGSSINMDQMNNMMGSNSMNMNGNVKMNNMNNAING